ncbi:MAG: carbohydrate ABC transporter permease [Treponema sp.]
MIKKNKTGNQILAVLLALLFILPFYWLVESTTKDISQLQEGTFLPGTPNHFINNNLKDVFMFRNGIFHKWMLNSCIYSLTGAFFATLFCSMAGYAFRRYRFRSRKILFILIMGFSEVPTFATTLPLFMEFQKLGLLSTSWSIIIPSLVNVFGVYLMVIYWKQVPEEMFDAAMIDGANEPAVFFRIGLPCIKPGFTTLFLISFVGIWNNYFLPLVMLNDDAKFPLILGITTITSLEGFPVYNLIIMGAFLTSLPLILLFIFLQKFLMPQLTGAIK